MASGESFENDTTRGATPSYLNESKNFAASGINTKLLTLTSSPAAYEPRALARAP